MSRLHPVLKTHRPLDFIWRGTRMSHVPDEFGWRPVPATARNHYTIFPFDDPEAMLS